MTDARGPVTVNLAQNIDVIRIAETLWEMHQAASDAMGYVQSLFDCERISRDEYDQQREIIKATQAQRLAELPPTALSSALLQAEAEKWAALLKES